MGTPSKVYKERIEMLKGATTMQTSAYTDTDYDAYMHGMSNGMLLAVAMMQDKEPKFLESFDKKSELDHKAEVMASRPEEKIEYDH